MVDLTIGVVLNLTGSVLINLGTNIVKFSHVKQQEEKKNELVGKILEERAERKRQRQQQEEEEQERLNGGSGGGSSGGGSSGEPDEFATIKEERSKGGGGGGGGGGTDAEADADDRSRRKRAAPRESLRRNSLDMPRPSPSGSEESNDIDGDIEEPLISITMQHDHHEDVEEDEDHGGDAADDGASVSGHQRAASRVSFSIRRFGRDSLSSESAKSAKVVTTSSSEDEGGVLSSDSDELSHSTTTSSQDSLEKKSLAEEPRKSFYIGWGMFAVGNALNFGSFSFAPQMVLSALGSIQFVANVFFGYYVLKSPLTNKRIWATLAIVAGNVLMVAAAGNNDTDDLGSRELLELWAEPGWLAYFAVVVVGSVSMHVVYRRLLKADLRQLRFEKVIPTTDILGRPSAVLAAKLHPKLVPFCYAAVSGMIGSQSVMLAKSTSLMFWQTITGSNQFTYFFTYVVILAWGGTMLFWLKRMNSALKMFDGFFIIPALQVIWILFSSLGGGIYFQEFDNLDLWKYFVYVIGILIIFYGVYGLSPDPPTESQRKAALTLPVSTMSRTQVYNLGKDDAHRGPDSRAPSRSARTSRHASTFMLYDDTMDNDSEASRSSLKPLVEQRRHSDPLVSKSMRVTHRDLAIELAAVAEGEEKQGTAAGATSGAGAGKAARRQRAASVDSGRHSYDGSSAVSRTVSMASLSALGGADGGLGSGDRDRRSARSSLSLSKESLVAADIGELKAATGAGGDAAEPVVDLEAMRSDAKLPETIIQIDPKPNSEDSKPADDEDGEKKLVDGHNDVPEASAATPDEPAALDAEIRQSILDNISKQKKRVAAPVSQKPPSASSKRGGAGAALPPVYLDRAYLVKPSQRRRAPHSAPMTVSVAYSADEKAEASHRQGENEHHQSDEMPMDAHTQALLRSHLLRLRQHQARMLAEEEYFHDAKPLTPPEVVVSPATAPHGPATDGANGSRPTVRFARNVMEIPLSPVPDDETTPSRTEPPSPRSNYGIADYLTFGLFARSRNKEKAKRAEVVAADSPMDSLDGFDDIIDVEEGLTPADGTTVPRSAILAEENFGEDEVDHKYDDNEDDVIINVEVPPSDQAATDADGAPAGVNAQSNPRLSESFLRSSPNRLAKSVKYLVSSVWPTRSAYQPMAPSHSDNPRQVVWPDPLDTAEMGNGGRPRAETEPTMTNSAEVSRHGDSSMSSTRVFESASSLRAKSGIVLGLSGKSMSVPSTPKGSMRFQRLVDDSAAEHRSSRLSDPILLRRTSIDVESPELSVSSEPQGDTRTRVRSSSSEIFNFVASRVSRGKLNASASSLSYVELDDAHHGDNESSAPAQESKMAPTKLDVSLKSSPESPRKRISPRPSPRSSMTGGRPPSSFPRKFLARASPQQLAHPPSSSSAAAVGKSSPLKMATRSTSLSMPPLAPIDLSASASGDAAAAASHPAPSASSPSAGHQEEMPDMPARPSPNLLKSARSLPAPVSRTAQIHSRPAPSSRKNAPIISSRGRSKEPRSPMNVQQLNRSHLRQSSRAPKSTTTTMRRSALRSGSSNMRSKTPPPASSPFSIMGHLRNASALLSTAGFLAASSSGESPFYPEISPTSNATPNSPRNGRKRSPLLNPSAAATDPANATSPTAVATTAAADVSAPTGSDAASVASSTAAAAAPSSVAGNSRRSSQRQRGRSRSRHRHRKQSKAATTADAKAAASGGA